MGNAGLNILGKFLLAIVAIYLLYNLYYFIKNEKNFFTAEVLNKSFFTMGVLAIILIILVSVAIFLLKLE